MKLQNTLTKEELEMVLQFSTTIYSAWKEGQRFLAAINTLKPSLMEEIRADKELFSRIFGMETVSAEVYLVICPDPPRMPEGFECPCCGRLLDELEADEDLLKDEPEEVKPIYSCRMCGQQLLENEERYCELCWNEFTEHEEEDV